jgi:hypothetical protein
VDFWAERSAVHQIQRLMDRGGWRLTRRPGGEAEGGGGASEPSKRLRTPRRRFHETPEGATTTAFYEIYEKAPEIIMLDTTEQVEEKGLRSKAAEFVIQLVCRS